MIKFIKNIVRRFANSFKETEQQRSDRIIAAIRNGGGLVGRNVDILSTNIDMSVPYLISIGDNVTITGSKILTHDGCLHKTIGYSKVGGVKIGSDVFIGYGCIILPNTIIGNKVIVGAGTVVAKDVPDNVVIGGNPWKILCTYDEFVERQRANMSKVPVIDLLPNQINLSDTPDEVSALKQKGKGFIK